MFIRKLNYVGLLTSLYTIATGSYREAELGEYERLPFGTKFLLDVILRNAQLKAHDGVPAIAADIGINLDEEYEAVTHRVVLVGKVVDIGDLHVFGAFQEVDLQGALVQGTEIKVDQRLSMERIKLFLAMQMKYSRHDCSLALGKGFCYLETGSSTDRINPSVQGRLPAGDLQSSELLTMHPLVRIAGRRPSPRSMGRFIFCDWGVVQGRSMVPVCTNRHIPEHEEEAL